jgi:N-sulfoglucosamine sulfohydrolase
MHRPIFSVLLILILCPAVKGVEEPNILFVLADDWGRNASCYRDPARPSVNDVIETPNIDRVAREGVLFRNAFIGVSSCAPSRASMASGCYFWRCGKSAFLQPDPGWEINKIPDPGDALPRFGALLQEAGYKTSVSGKALELDKRPPRIPLGGDGLRFSLYARKQRLGRNETAKVFEQAVRDVMQKVLSSRTPSQPFCHVLGPVGPHRPFAVGSGRKLWGIDPDKLKGKMPAFIPDMPEAREDYADSLGEVLALDLEVGVILDELQNAGELDNTMFVLSGDNGVNMPRGKTHCYDIAVHAPLMIHWPAGIAKPGRVVNDFVNQIDLAPTWLEVAGFTPPAAMDGRSLLPLLTSDKSGMIDPSRDHAIVGRERHEAETRPDLDALSDARHPHCGLSLHPQLQARPLAIGRSLQRQRSQRRSEPTGQWHCRVDGCAPCRTGHQAALRSYLWETSGRGTLRPQKRSRSDAQSCG